MPGATQLLVRRTMLEAGGYWRPLAALARLLEELGELAELTSDRGAPPGGPPEGALAPPEGPLASELADLWIITTALADQFLGEVPEPGEAPGADRASAGEEAGAHRPGTAPDAAAAVLLPAAGEIARVVNFYDGPKNPREVTALPSLAGAVAVFHERLARLAEELGVELRSAVQAKLRTVRASEDMRRFARERSDPSTSPLLERARAGHPETAEMRLWGAPEGGPETVRHALTSFTKACGPERLEAFVIEPGALEALEPEHLGLMPEPLGELLLLRAPR